MDALPNSYVVGIMYIVGAALWTLECLLSIWVLQMVCHCDYIEFVDNHSNNDGYNGRACMSKDFMFGTLPLSSYSTAMGTNMNWNEWMFL